MNDIRMRVFTYGEINLRTHVLIYMYVYVYM